MRRTVLRGSQKWVWFLVLVLVLVVAPRPSTAQDVSLRGFIVSAETGQPLPGANMILRRLDEPGPADGAIANEDGYYFLSGIAPGRYALRVSYVGYRTIRDTARFTNTEEPVTRTFELRPAEQQLEELVVTGRMGGATTLEAGAQRVTSEDVAHIPTPSISGDLANYLQAMPGIVSVGDRGGQLYIRGGTPDQNLVMMDKMQIFRPFHIVGFYSAFPQELISDAQVYAGGFPARYSGRLSAVIDVEMRGGNHEHVEAAATASPFLTGIRAEGPLNDSGLSLIGAARFSQIERTAPTVLGQEQHLKFNDQFVKLQSTFESGRCGVTGMRTYDRGLVDPAANNVFRWSNFALGGRCVGSGPGSSTLLDASLSTSNVRNAVGEAGSPEREATFSDIAGKLDLTHPFGGGKEIQGGLKLHMYELRYTLGEKFQVYQADDANWMTINGFLEGTYPIGSTLELKPGLAVRYTFDYGATLEPRFRATWQPFGSPEQEANLAVGRYQQTFIGLSDERDVGSVFTAWTAAPKDRGRPAAWHAIAGWRQQLGPVSLTAEGYFKDLQNLAVPEWSTIARFTTAMTSAEGRSWGFDVRAEFERGSFYGYLGYGFSWTRYTMRQENFDQWYGTDAESYHPPHDRRHEINLVVSADLGIATADVRWQLGSGLPYTKPFGFDNFISLSGLMESPKDFGTPRILFEKAYQGRTPVYHRLDVSLERSFELGPATLTAKGGAINAYDRQNLFYFDFFTQRRVNQLPLVPYLALEIATD